jgi:hypothetical protein
MLRYQDSEFFPFFFDPAQGSRKLFPKWREERYCETWTPESKNLRMDVELSRLGRLSSVGCEEL